MAVHQRQEAVGGLAHLGHVGAELLLVVFETETEAREAVHEVQDAVGDHEAPGGDRENCIDLDNNLVVVTVEHAADGDVLGADWV